MAKAIPNPEPPRNGGGLEPRAGLSRDQASLRGITDRATGREPWRKENLLVDDANSTPPASGSSLPPLDTGMDSSGASDDPAVGQLQAENAELRSIIMELQQEMESLNAKIEQDWAERQKEYETLLDEKNDTIRTLHMKTQELQDQIRPPTPKEEELITMSEELERERCQLLQERKQVDEDMRQLKEDSEIMNKEMRQMEVQMARERADLARQRNEMQRLSEEIRQELERIERDRGLTDRLGQLRQRHSDVLKGKNAGPGGTPGTPPARTQLAIDLDAEVAREDPTKKKDSGMLRRFFGKEKS